MLENNLDNKQTLRTFDEVLGYASKNVKDTFYAYRGQNLDVKTMTLCFYHKEYVRLFEDVLRESGWRKGGVIDGIKSCHTLEQGGETYQIEVVWIKHFLDVRRFIYFAKFIDTFSLNELFHITDELWDKSSNKPTTLYKAFGRFVTMMYYGEDSLGDIGMSTISYIQWEISNSSSHNTFNEMLKSLDYQYLVTRFIQNNIDSNYNKFQYVKGSEKIIAIDFDDTLCDSNYPHCGDYVEGANEAIEKIHKAGYSIIIWTCRANEALLEAFRWCMYRAIPFDFMNKSHIEIIEKFGGDNRKVFAHHYVDDRNIGGFIGWGKVLEHLGI